MVAKCEGKVILPKLSFYLTPQRLPFMRAEKVPGIRRAAAQYEVADRIVDLSTFDVTQNPWRAGNLFDAIITDPPCKLILCIILCAVLNTLQMASGQEQNVLGVKTLPKRGLKNVSLRNHERKRAFEYTTIYSDI